MSDVLEKAVAENERLKSQLEASNQLLAEVQQFLEYKDNEKKKLEEQVPLKRNFFLAFDHSNC